MTLCYFLPSRPLLVKAVSSAASNATIEGVLETTPTVDANIETRFDNPVNDDAIAIVARAITAGLNDVDVDVDLDVVDGVIMFGVEVDDADIKANSVDGVNGVDSANVVDVNGVDAGDVNADDVDADGIDANGVDANGVDANGVDVVDVADDAGIDGVDVKTDDVDADGVDAGDTDRDR